MALLTIIAVGAVAIHLIGWVQGASVVAGGGCGRLFDDVMKLESGMLLGNSEMDNIDGVSTSMTRTVNAYRRLATTNPGDPASMLSSISKIEEQHLIFKHHSCTYSLVRAINAALADINGSQALPDLLAEHSRENHVPVNVCHFNIANEKPIYSYPERTDIDDDILSDVLSRGELLVSSYGEIFERIIPGTSNTETIVRGVDWGKDGNWSTDTPTGFYPDVLRLIVNRIATQYETSLKIKWVYFATGEGCRRAVVDGLVHMTDIYFFQSTHSPTFDITEFAMTCSVSSTKVFMYANKDSGITTVNQAQLGLRLPGMASKFIQSMDKIAMRTIVYMTEANARLVHHNFPKEALISIESDPEKAEKMIINKQALLFINTSETLTTELQSVDTPWTFGQGPQIKRVATLECVLSKYDLQYIPEERVVFEKKSSAGFPLTSDISFYCCGAFVTLLAGYFTVGR